MSEEDRISEEKLNTESSGRRRRRRAPLPELESELKRERYRARYLYTIRSTIFTLITVAAAADLRVLNDADPGGRRRRGVQEDR